MSSTEHLGSGEQDTHTLEASSNEVAGAWTDPDQDETSSHAEFDGDVGGLDPVSRRAFVLLMKNRFITGRSHRQEFAALVRDQTLIRSRLNDMYLSLEIDDGRQVAYKQQVVSETSGRYPTLLSATTWGREETILLVFLRAQIRASRALGHERAFVERADLQERLTELNPVPDQSRALAKYDRAIESLASAGILVGRMDADNFEIDPAVEALINQRVLEQLLAWVHSDGRPTESGAAETSDVPTPNTTDDTDVT
ncbi:DUF4194 domain-containing protein [Oerskovia paurometabola]|uniref:DUF4194 domain-containing protein n=1 Tax=Oerskovia paurometabola TaxID=162170 RepID=UPI0038144AD6